MINLLVITFISLSLIFLLDVVYSQRNVRQDDFEYTLFHDSLMRRYLVYIPPSYSKDIPIPVVLNFHGGGGNAERTKLKTKMDVTADQKGFMVVYPEGSGRKILLDLVKLTYIA
ncbi:PHB depolymerase family esterase [Thermodesulfobacteriota bacterium]